MEEYALCKVFVSANLDADQLRGVIHGLVEGSVRPGTVETDAGVGIDVMRNEDYDPIACARADRKSFLCFPLYLDVCDMAASLPTAPFVSFVAELLRSLWSRGMIAVAACDFEDQLPQSGRNDGFGGV